MLRSKEQRERHGVSPQKRGEEREAWMKRTDAEADRSGEPMKRAFSGSWYWQYRREVDGVMTGTSATAMPDHIVSEVQAREFAKREVEAIRLREEAARLEVRADLQRQVSNVKAGKWCSMGEYIAAVTVVLMQRNRQQFQRAISNMRMVVAIAQGWKMPFDGTRMTAELCARVDALSIEVVCAATSEAYMLACQVAAGVALEGSGGPMINWTDRNPAVINRVINSNLGNACVAVGKRQRTGEVMKLAVPWAIVREFGARRLPVPVKDVGEEVPSGDSFDAMMKGFADLITGDERAQELALVNELLRKLGLRSGELTMARESWLLDLAGKWYVDVKDRPLEGFACKGAKAALLPINEEMAGRLRARCVVAREKGLENPFLILPMLPGGMWLQQKQKYAELEARRACVRDQHNAWLKGFIGKSPSGKGNHRLRALCATRIYRAVRAKLEAAGESVERAHDAAATEVQNFIRHESEATTLLHYIAPDMMRVSKHVTAAMLDDVLG